MPLSGKFFFSESNPHAVVLTCIHPGSAGYFLKRARVPFVQRFALCCRTFLTSRHHHHHRSSFCSLRFCTVGQVTLADNNGHLSARFCVMRRERRRLLDLSMRVTVFNPLTASSCWRMAAVLTELRVRHEKQRRKTSPRPAANGQTIPEHTRHMMRQRWTGNARRRRVHRSDPARKGTAPRAKMAGVKRTWQAAGRVTTEQGIRRRRRRGREASGSQA